jgi:single-strand DNA-binding protein
MNKITLTGNIVRDTDLKQTSDGKVWLSNAIAVRDDYKSKDGSYHSQFFDIVAFGITAQYINTYCLKGTKVLIEGRLVREDYQDKQGNSRQAYKINVNSVESFRTDTTQSKKANNTVSQEKPYDNEIREEDLPF